MSKQTAGQKALASYWDVLDRCPYKPPEDVVIDAFLQMAPATTINKVVASLEKWTTPSSASGASEEQTDG